MNARTTGLAAVAATLIAGAGTAHGAYVKVTDPTGAVAGKQGGVVIGAANGERTVEGGICNKHDGAFGAFASYYYLYGSAERPPGTAGYNVQDDDCSGDAPSVREAYGNADAVGASVRPNGLPTRVVFSLAKDGGAAAEAGQADAGAGWDRKAVALPVDLAPGEYVLTTAATNDTGTTTTTTAFTVAD
jgi:hypothetical protein